jgi:hypothetical protein
MLVSDVGEGALDRAHDRFGDKGEQALASGEGHLGGPAGTCRSLGHHPPRPHLILVVDERLNLFHQNCRGGAPQPSRSDQQKDTMKLS